MASDESRVRATDNAFDVLDALVELDGAGVTELTAELDISKSAVYKHLATLEARGYVVQAADSSYRLGVKALKYGGFARKQAFPLQRIQTAVADLAAETGELVVFATLTDEGVLSVYQVRGEHAVTTDSYAGITLPVHCTASGKAILAEMGEGAGAVLDEADLAARTPATITDRERLEEDLAGARERGFSLEDQERIDGMRGIGAAIRNEESGEVLGALALTAPTHRLDGDRFTESVPALLANRARETEINITYE